MVVLSCKFLSILAFKSHPIVIRMGDTTFLATWDDNVGVVYLTKAKLKEFTTGSDNGEHITSMLNKHCFHWYTAYCQESDKKYLWKRTT